MEVGATSLCQIYSCVDFKILSIDTEGKQTRNDILLLSPSLFCCCLVNSILNSLLSSPVQALI